MHKRKDGKVVASLTEVKNKTGDIFTLVDEFGEVILTSYNKPKYRIVKVNIAETLNLEESEQPKKREVKRVTAKPSVIHKVKRTVTTITTKPKTSFGINEATQIKLADSTLWDRNNPAEVAYVLKIRESIQ